MVLACGVLKFRKPDSMMNVLWTNFQAATDDNKLPSGSQISEGSENSEEPNHCLVACRVPYLALSACIMLVDVSK